MPKIICTVPETTPKALILVTESAFKAMYTEHFPGVSSPTLLWILAPSGQTFQAGAPADLYLAMIEVENGLEPARREAVLWAFTTRWAEVLDVDIKRLAVTVADQDTASAFMRGNRNRLRPWGRIRFVLLNALHILRTRRTDGFAQLRVNF